MYSYDRRTAAVQLKKVPNSSKQEPMWKTVDGRFLVMTFRSYTNRGGKKFYTLTYTVLEQDASGKHKIDHGEAPSLNGAKRLIEKATRGV